MRTVIVYEGPEAPPVDTASTRFVSASREAVVEVARRERDTGATRIELCGGLGPVPHAAVRDAVGSDVEVGAVMYGFESLENTADFKRRFAAGEQLRAAFLFLEPGADPTTDRHERGDTLFVALPDEPSVARVAAELVRLDVLLLELYAGLGPAAAAAALAGVSDTPTPVSVGLACYPNPS